MSRAAQRSGASASKRAPAGAPSSTTEDGDICPVCKSSRYLNPNMRFLVNPECYHKMCESCVDRIFSHGPAPCPIAGCRRTLRKVRFRTQTFEDVQIEREVDIRRRVAEVFNQREEDFESLRAYNDHLNEVEDMTFNLIQRIDLEATERKLRTYAEANKQKISKNTARAREEARQSDARQTAEKERARQRREAAAREDEEDTKALAEVRQQLLTKLTEGGDATAIERAAKQEVERRKMARQAAAAEAARKENEEAEGETYVIKGLKKRTKAEPQKPYDPFGGLSIQRDYYTLQDDYDWEWLASARADTRHVAGGYDFSEYYTRALCDAFAGFGVFVEDEVKDTGNAQTDSFGGAGASKVN